MEIKITKGAEGLDKYELRNHCLLIGYMLKDIIPEIENLTNELDFELGKGAPVLITKLPDAVSQKINAKLKE